MRVPTALGETPKWAIAALQYSEKRKIGEGIQKIQLARPGAAVKKTKNAKKKKGAAVSPGHDAILLLARKLKPRVPLQVASSLDPAWGPCMGRGPRQPAPCPGADAGAFVSLITEPEFLPIRSGRTASNAPHCLFVCLRRVLFHSSSFFFFVSSLRFVFALAKRIFLHAPYVLERLLLLSVLFMVFVRADDLPSRK